MTSHALSLVLFRPPPTWRLGRGVQKCGHNSCEKMTTRPLAMLAKRLFRQKGGNTTNKRKHLSTQYAITLQECHVFDALRNDDNVNESQPSNSSAANVSASSVNITGKLLQTLSIVLVPFVSLYKPAFTICLCQFYF